MAMSWPVDTATQTSATLGNERDRALKRRHGRTPFRIQLKFTPEEWRLFGERANEANRSRYNFGKRAVLVGIVLSEERLQELERQYHQAAGIPADNEVKK